MSDAIDRQLLQLKSVKARKEARDNLLRYIQLQMPDPEHPGVAEKSRYVVTAQAILLCQIMEKVERGEYKRVAVSIGPQLGKSEVLSRGFPAWAVGRDPYRNLMLGTYNQSFADEFGSEVRSRIQSEVHQSIFPKHTLDKGAVDLLITPEGGKTAFVGVGGSGTGKPADFFIVDDPIRSDEDAQSALYRDRIWKWFNAVVFTRCHSKSRIVVVHCLTGDTRVTMADFTRKRLDQIEVGDMVAAHENGQFVSRKVLNFASQGEDDVFIVKTGSSTVRANARHPFAVLRHGAIEWVKTSDLKIGDLIVTSSVETSDEKRLTEVEAWLLGFMFGDGWLTRRDTTQIDTKTGKTHPRRGWVTCAAFSGKQDEDAKFEAAFHSVFGFLPKRTKYGYWRTERQAAGKWFAERGLVGKAKTKVLPAWLFRQHVDVKRAFIAGLNHADGTEDKKKQKNIAMSNPGLIRDVRDLARSTGLCVSNVHMWSAHIQPPNSKAPVYSEIWSFKWGVAECEDAFRAKPITAIEPAGRAEVFDLQVEGSENFIADGMVVHNTRWHGDDLIGRLCDPNHPERNKAYAGIADEWIYINLPAVVEDPELAASLGLTLTVPTSPRIVEQFGKKPMSALWPERKGLDFLAEAKRMDPRTFNALYMGNPTGEDGEYFKAEWISEYDAHELPDRLHKYGASDHAVSEKQKRDYTVLGCVGVCENDTVWVMPDLAWDRMATDRTVEEMLLQFRIHKPELWWMEDELISKSFGPFLHKRMIEERLYTTIDPVRPAKDKQTRARAIQGRMSLKQVRFPRFAPWWQDAKSQILRFPFGANDDFVDWLAHIGMGTGIRSLRSRDGYDAAYASDVGSAIDPFVQGLLNSTVNRDLVKAKSVIEGTDGRFFMSIGDKVLVLSYFPASKITAWSYIDFGLTIDELVRSDRDLYLRSANTIYTYGGEDGDTYPDAGEFPAVAITPFASANDPASKKQLKSYDHIASNTWRVQVLVDPNDTSKMVDIGRLIGVTNNDAAAWLPGNTALFALQYTCDSAGYASLSAVANHFDTGEKQ